MEKHNGLKSMIWIALCLSLVIYPNLAQPNEASNRLSTDLMKKYNKMIRGVKDMGEKTTLRLEFSLIRIAEFDEVNGKLSLVGFFNIYWHDYRMEWDPEKYNDTYTILFEEKEVWKPLIVLASPQEELKTLGHADNFFVRFNPSGNAEWYPGDIWATACTPDVYRYPYDTQSCVVTYVIWAYAVHEITVKVVSDKVILNVYTPHGMWDLIDTSVTSSVDVARQLTTIDVTLVMRRIPTFHLINMILPIVSVGLLNILVFLLPAQSGERVGYSITVLLAIAVFQTITSDSVPSVSEPKLSLLCIKLLADLIVSALVTTLTIVTLYFYHMPESRRVPSCIAAVTRVLLCKNCCKDKTTNSPDFVNEKNSLKNGIDALESISVNNNHSGDVTWADVGKSSDIVFAVFSLLMFLASNILFALYVAF